MKFSVWRKSVYVESAGRIGSILNFVRTWGLISVLSISVGWTLLAAGLAAISVLILLNAVVIVVVTGVVVTPAMRKRVTVLSLMSYIIVTICGIVAWSFPSLRSPDGFTYDDAARALSANGFEAHQINSPGLYSGKQGYAFILAGLYRVFGDDIHVGIIINALFLALLIPVLSDTTRRLAGDAAANYVPWIILMWPALIYWGSQPLREAGILLLLAISVNAAVRIHGHPSFSGFFTLIGSIVALSTFRQYVAAVMGMSLIGVLVLIRARGASKLKTVLLGLLLAAPGFFFLSRSPALQEVMSSDASDIGNLREGISDEGGSSVGLSVDISSPLDILWSLPKTVPVMLFGPPPWLATSLTQLMGALDSALWLGVVVVAYVGYRELSRRGASSRFMLAISFVVLTVVIASIAGNYGWLVRMRLQLFILLIPLIANGLAVKSSNRLRRIRRIDYGAYKNGARRKKVE